MSRGRPHHQSSRRRTYSVRQREIRDRRTRAIVDERRWTDERVAFEIEEGLEFESPTSWGVRLNGRPTAA